MTENPPNILFLMSDQMSALALPMYAGRGALTPHLDALSARGTVFENAYCAFPLCGPSRAAMMTGRLPSRIGAYDNAGDFPSHVPTLVHYLRLAGYSTTVSGKLHYVGADQLHGFEERLSTDIYPADFTWTPPPFDGRPLEDAPRGERTGKVSGTETVIDAGPYARSMQMDYDEEVFAAGRQKLFDLARGRAPQPFFLMVSFTQPHDPYVTPRRYWDRYREEDIPAPRVPAPAPEEDDPHTRELRRHYGIDRCPVGAEETMRARHGYFGMISDIDDKVGQLVETLEETGLGRNTAIVYTSDHGDMMGERGLWFKKTFFEWAMRIPLIVTLPKGRGGRRVARNVSHLDLLPTLAELAGVEPDTFICPLDGRSLVPDLLGEPSPEGGTVAAEHLDEGTRAPRLMLRRGRHKYVCSDLYPPRLHDLESDPDELENLAGAPALAEVEESFRQRAAGTWDLPACAPASSGTASVGDWWTAPSAAAAGAPGTSLRMPRRAGTCATRTASPMSSAAPTCPTRRRPAAERRAAERLRRRPRWTAREV